MRPPLNRLMIVAVVYDEKDYMKTLLAINECGFPVHYVRRKPSGVGSLSEAINRGFIESRAIEYEYVWFVTNITFDPGVPTILMDALRQGYEAVHPSFDSDHPHLRQIIGSGVVEAPFIEFTAPMFVSGVFDFLRCDERMPYWGMDLDISYRLHALGFSMAVDHRVKLGHTYIRHTKQKEQVTLQRQLRRKQTDAGTRLALKKKFEGEWGCGVNWDKRSPITALYETVAKKIIKKV